VSPALCSGVLRRLLLSTNGGPGGLNVLGGPHRPRGPVLLTLGTQAWPHMSIDYSDHGAALPTFGPSDQVAHGSLLQHDQARAASGAATDAGAEVG
jgi:hypothetical protein